MLFITIVTGHHQEDVALQQRLRTGSGGVFERRPAELMKEHHNSHKSQMGMLWWVGSSRGYEYKGKKKICFVCEVLIMRQHKNTIKTIDKIAKRIE